MNNRYEVAVDFQYKGKLMAEKYIVEATDSVMACIDAEGIFWDSAVAQDFENISDVKVKTIRMGIEEKPFNFMEALKEIA